MYTRLKAIMKKEMRHILRDPRTLAIIFAMPVFMVLVFGYALNMDIEHIRLAVLDHSRTAESRELIRSFGATDYFDIVLSPKNRREAEQAVHNGTVKATLIIPSDYADKKHSGGELPVQMLVDGSDPLYGNAITNYGNAVIMTKTSGETVGQSLPLEIRERFLYNPDLEGTYFITPGIVAVILMMVCALLTSITVAREKETGTMDVLLVSPVHPREIIIGKAVPYVALAMIDAVIILAMSRILFHIPMRGDLILLTGLSLLYIFCALGMGLMISTVAASQQVAMMIALVATILPSMILSGFVFSIFSMPAPIRLLTWGVPARHYMQIIRGILLKNNTLYELMTPILMIAAISLFFMVTATLRFKTRTK